MPAPKGSAYGYKHGHCKRGAWSPTYWSWMALRKRCLYPRNHAYARYAPLWYEPWNSFEQFLADMGERPAGLTLERKDNTLPYSPDNCVWATRAAQSRNTAATKLSYAIAEEIRASKETSKQLAERHNVDRSTINRILKRIIYKEPT